jgi:rubrerythrin
MKAHTPKEFPKPHHFTRTFFIVVLSALALSMLVPLSGCKKSETKQSQPEITLQNLQTAYAREMRIGREYALFSKRAERDRYGAIANLYRAASRSEQIHAEMAAALLRSKGVEVNPFTPDSITVGTVMQTLRLATSDEGLETESMYPNLARTAELEKFPEAAESFRRTLDADKRHLELFKEALDKGGTIARIQYYVCPTCGYIITSDKIDECPGCHTKKEKFEKI